MPLMNSSTQTVASFKSTPSPFRILLYAICIIGIILNSGVLFAIIKTAKKHSLKMRTSILLLCTMAVADTISLAALLLMINAKYFTRNDFIEMNLICKLDLFIIHSSSAYSLWCWLVLSAVRYLAICRPYVHMQLSKEPFIAVFAVAVMCIIMELWILIEVQFIPETKSCGDSVSEEWARRLQVAEIIWSYFLPLIIITALDIKVLCCHSDRWTGTSISKKTSRSNDYNQFQRFSDANSVDHASFQAHRGAATSRSWRRKSRSKRHLLQRCLAITVLDLGLNLPSYLTRLWINLASDEQFAWVNAFVMILIEDISQLLYFGQFALNAFYLVCIIYGVPRRKTQTTVKKNFLRYTMKKLNVQTVEWMNSGY